MSKNICGELTADGSPCEHPACRTDGKCWMHTEADEPANVGRPSKVDRYGDKVIKRLKEHKSLRKAVEGHNVTANAVLRWIKLAKKEEPSKYDSFLSDIKQTEWWDYKDRFAPGKTRKSVKCDICGALKQVRLWRFEKFDKHYCSDHHPTTAGRDSPNWKENSRAYMGPNWKEQRSKALERANYNCESCGLTDKEHREKYDYGLHVHHIIARDNFADNDPEQNKLENLSVLCHRCHEMYEGTNLSPVQRECI